MATPDTLLYTARQQWLADDHQAALDSFRQAMAAQPHDLRLAVEAASYLGMRFEIAEAVGILKRCEESLFGNAEGLHQVGLAYERAYRPDDALRCFQSVVQFATDHANSWVKIAEWHERRGHLQQAWESIEQCTQAADVGEVRLWRGKMLRRLGDGGTAESTLTALATDPSASMSARADAWYELAELHDRLGDAERAFSAATAAKSLQRPSVLPHLKNAQSLARLETNFVKTVSRDHYQRWQEQAAHRPIALLTGPPRSGTTLMARILGMHPNLTVGDEINVYPTYVHKEMLAGKRGTSAGDVLDSIDGKHLSQCQTRYRQWMAAATAETVTEGFLLDKNPSVTFLVPAFRRLFPQAVVAMALRDPRDVVISCFLRNLPLNPVSAMFNQLDLTVMRCHAEYMAWLELRKKLTSPWCELRYEDIARGDYKALQQVLDSLGLEWKSEFTEFQSSLGAKPVRSPTYAQLFEPINTGSIGRWQAYRKHLEPFLPRLEEIGRSLGY